MPNSSAVLATQSSGVLDKVSAEFSSLSAKIKSLEDEKKALQDRVSSLELEKKELNPENLAKFYAESKALAAQEKSLLASRAAVLPKVEKAKAVYDEAVKELNGVDASLKSLSDKGNAESALLFARVDAYANEAVKDVEGQLSRAKSERTRAENERQAANDVMLRAEAQLKKIQDNGKSTLEKIAKIESEHEAKLKNLKEQIDSGQKEEARLKKEVSYLADLHEKRKKLEAGIK